MNPSKIIALACAWCCCWVSGCNTSEPTTAVLSNEYPAASDADSADLRPVYKGWWAVAQFPEPVPAGQVSEPVRIVPGSDYGYALLAPGWDAASTSAPTMLIALRSAQKLSVARGELLTFVVSEQATMGDCRAGQALTQEEADFVTQRIFPVEFAGLSYQAESCTTAPAGAGAGGALDAAGAGGEAGAP